MRQLLYKDIRVFRFAFWAGLAAWVVGGIWIWFQDTLSPMYSQSPGLNEQSFGYITLFLASIIAAITGACCFASERRSRTADFLGMLPASRGQIVLSKLMIAISYVALLAAVSVLLIYDGSTRGDAVSVRGMARPEEFAHQVRTVAMLVGWIILNFGVGYLFSSAVANPTYAGIGSLLFWGILALTMAVIIIHAHISDHAGQAIYTYVPITIGINSLLAGCQIYERRVAP